MDSTIPVVRDNAIWTGIGVVVMLVLAVVALTLVLAYLTRD
jgi:hypothetical protein